MDIVFTLDGIRTLVDIVIIDLICVDLVSKVTSSQKMVVVIVI
jgi:hypothetical protein